MTAPTGEHGAAVLEVEDLHVSFPTDDGLVRAVRGASYAVRRGETLGIVGESGSGKSVTSLAVMGLLPRGAQVTGAVRLHGKDILALSENDLRDIRGKQIAMIFQDPMTSLNPVYSVGWQIEEALRAHDKKLSSQAAHTRAVELLRLVEIPSPEQRVGQYPHEFSGGMRQRAVIAIGIANDPDVIIADEPTTALDVTVQAQILETLAKAQDETGAAMVLITHDLGVVAGTADRVLVMYAGRPVEVGDVDQLYYSPRMPYTVGLLGALPRLDSRESGRLTPILGAPPSLINIPAGCPFGPRCPLHQERCDEEEPPLAPVEGAGHSAACWYSDLLAPQGIEASDVFAPTATDQELPGTMLAPGEEAAAEIGAEEMAKRLQQKATSRTAAKAPAKAPAKKAAPRKATGGDA